MSTLDQAQKNVEADLASTPYRIGERRGYWRALKIEFPIVYFAVASVEKDKSNSEYVFKFELTGFPDAAPEARIWDLQAGAILAPDRRPTGSTRLEQAFKAWGNETVYRPWDRQAGAHGNWAQQYPDLSWSPQRNLVFALEDLHGLLTSNILAS